MKFVLPAIMFLFTLALTSVWLVDREQKFLVICGSSFALVGMAILMQISFVPVDSGLNAVLSGAFYVAGCQLASYGILQRSGLRLPHAFYVVSFVLIVGGLYFFYYIERSLVARIYILNLGMGFIFLSLAWRLRSLWWGQLVDKVLLGFIVVLSLHFFPRTIMTANALIGTQSAEILANSVFWSLAIFSTAMVGTSMGLMLLVTTGVDMARNLQRERDTDLLTGLLNRRGLINQVSKFIGKNRVMPDSIIVCDLDYFKSINDTYGHNAGDQVLQKFASIVRGVVGPDIIVARIGGEEFLLVLRQKTVAQAFQIAEILRQKTENTTFQPLLSDQILTSSFGVAKLRMGEDFWTAVDRADKILYAAKKAGRNRTLAEGMQFPYAA